MANAIDRSPNESLTSHEGWEIVFWASAGVAKHRDSTQTFIYRWRAVPRHYGERYQKEWKLGLDAPPPRAREGQRHDDWEELMVAREVKMKIICTEGKSNRVSASPNAEYDRMESENREWRRGDT